MLPRLTPPPTMPPLPAGFLDRLIEAGFRGDIERDEAARTVSATDNSIYQVMPQALLFPRDARDLVTITRTASEPAFRNLVLGPRGGGTGTNGQSLTSGVVIDCSRHMKRILDIDPVRRVARVEAGVVKDELNRALKPHGLFFAPELSTSNRATIGGMVSTDACGQGSCLYGKTSDHVLGLRIVLADGSDWWSRPLDAPALAAARARPDRIGAIHRIVDDIHTGQKTLIEATFPPLNRSMTGYDLAHIRKPDGRFNLNAVLCGSEGTLALIAEVELNLLPIPSAVALINIRYGNFDQALRDARRLTSLGVASVETIDETVLGLARKDVVWQPIALWFPDDPEGSAEGVNIVEVLADNEALLEQTLSRVTHALDESAEASHRGYTIARGHAQAEAIWAMRKRAVGLLGSVEGPVRPVAFVEDTAVPPENLADYIAEFRALLDAEGLRYGMFGHVDAGVLHVRPALDLTRDAHREKVRRISDAVVALTRRHGGVLWGEHGKGVRSEYVPAFFGPLYPSLQAIKAAFDPFNQLNPGKIAAPGETPLQRIDEVPLRGERDALLPETVRAAFDNGPYCNGNGACFDFDPSSPMCPSYKATKDRRQSPKGRAALLREWLSRLAEEGVDLHALARSSGGRSGVATFVRRAFNSLNPGNRNDFSHEVRAAMDTCLGCKACAAQCPVKVNVPGLRSKFLEAYFGRYLRPPKDRLIASIETLLPLMTRLRPAYNAVIGTRAGNHVMRHLGLAALPALTPLTLRAMARAMKVQTADPARLSTLSKEDRARCVIFVVDPFVAGFDPRVAAAAFSLARRLGLLPWLAEGITNGKALHVHGFRSAFARAALKSAGQLNALAATGIPLVGLDPSMTLTFRSEYKDVEGMGLDARVLLPQEWLAGLLDRIPQAEAPSGRVALMLHCTERTALPQAGSDWKTVFAAAGIDLDVPPAGCCGMAGTFGHEARNRALSEQIFQMDWQARVRQAQDGATLLMATGYSCRSQVHTIEGTRPPHPLEVLDQWLGTENKAQIGMMSDI